MFFGFEGADITYEVCVCDFDIIWNLTLTILDKKEAKRIQSISRTSLYYTRSTNACMLPAINEISASQAQPIEYTNKRCTILMDYNHTYPNAVIHYHVIDMRLHIDSDAAYLVMPNARSRGARHFYLSNHPTNPVDPLIKKNGEILT